MHSTILLDAILAWHSLTKTAKLMSRDRFPCQIGMHPQHEGFLTKRELYYKMRLNNIVAATMGYSKGETVL